MAAGIDDTYDIKHVGRWIDQDEAASSGGLRTGKAFAVADALSKKGIVVKMPACLCGVHDLV